LRSRGPSQSGRDPTRIAARRFRHPVWRSELRRSRPREKRTPRCLPGNGSTPISTAGSGCLTRRPTAQRPRAARASPPCTSTLPPLAGPGWQPRGCGGGGRGPISEAAVPGTSLGTPAGGGRLLNAGTSFRPATAGRNDDPGSSPAPTPGSHASLGGATGERLMGACSRPPEGDGRRPPRTLEKPGAR